MSDYEIPLRRVLTIIPPTGIRPESDRHQESRTKPNHISQLQRVLGVGISANRNKLTRQAQLATLLKPRIARALFQLQPVGSTQRNPQLYSATPARTSFPYINPFTLSRMLGPTSSLSSSDSFIPFI